MSRSLEKDKRKVKGRPHTFLSLILFSDWAMNVQGIKPSQRKERKKVNVAVLPSSLYLFFPIHSQAIRN